MRTAPVLVTGAAGFIGFHAAASLLAQGLPVVGVDNLTPYYDVGLKQARLAELERREGFAFARLDLADRAGLDALFAAHRFERVLHLAAQAGVRYGSVDPGSYISANLVGFANLLEACRHGGVGHLVYASTSSVYGGNAKLPFAESDPVDHPLSLYAATKKSNELMAHAYSHLFGLPTTGLRFFTVYGPWGRPDMSYWLFTEAILAGRPIQLFNGGAMERDFTYVDDIVEALVRLLDRPATPDPGFDPADPDAGTSSAPWRIYNIGNDRTVPLTTFVATLERCLGRTAAHEMLPMQPGDVPATRATIDRLAAAIGFRPATPLEVGLQRFVDWYRGYRGQGSHRD